MTHCFTEVSVHPGCKALQQEYIRTEALHIAANQETECRASIKVVVILKSPSLVINFL